VQEVAVLAATTVQFSEFPPEEPKLRPDALFVYSGVTPSKYRVLHYLFSLLNVQLNYLLSTAKLAEFHLWVSYDAPK
jgi:hypothetical protein